ncbi:hypothetical protein [Bradyrhizobium campsiandrae]|nr:hypothetical protein [Bradyrhizobium campsiandrae]
MVVQDRQQEIARFGKLLVGAVLDQMRVDEARIDVLAVELEQLPEPLM